MRANVMRWVVSGFMLVLLAAMPAHAQSLTGSGAVVPAAPAAGAASGGVDAAAALRPTASPLLARDAAAPLAPARADLADARVAERLHEGTDFALMVVGGALFVAGAIMGGDAGTVFMVGGAVIGAYGLYQYLR